ncbi:MAG: hypothetical protein GXP08_18275 [Gammaproteobacteria bacterium]|nr:hypothetical protein [Gammaproteobacteria bacterium]
MNITVNTDTITHFISEHITELGFLLTVPQVNDYQVENDWSDDIDRQHRIEAHRSALAVQEGDSVDLAIQFLDSYDEDQVLGAAYTLACSSNSKGLDAVVAAYGNVEHEFLWCYVDAFKHGSHAQLSAQLKPYLQHANPALVAATIDILGYRREGDPRQFWSLLRHDNDTVRMAAIIALMRFGYKAALPAIEQMIWARPIEQRSAFLYPLLALGSEKIRQHIYRLCQEPALTTPESLIYLAMSAGDKQLPTLIQQFPGEETQLAALQALGIYGHIGAIPQLLNALTADNEAMRVQAGEALQMLTGAGLREELHVQEEEEPDLTVADILGQDTRADLDGEALDAQTKPRLKKVIRVCSDHPRWQSWWQENKQNFDNTHRYRHGAFFSLNSCIETLANDAHANAEQRHNAYAELVIRSGNPVAFEPDWFVTKQRQAIARWQRWWETAKPKLGNQQWLFNGQ